MKVKNYQAPLSEVRRANVRASLLQSSVVNMSGQQEGDAEDPDARVRLNTPSPSGASFD